MEFFGYVLGAGVSVAGKMGLPVFVPVTGSPALACRIQKRLRVVGLLKLGNEPRPGDCLRYEGTSSPNKSGLESEP